MLTFLLIGIFVCSTYPSYMHHILKARRYDGQLALLDLANHLEHFHAEQHTYETATMGTGKFTDIKSNDLSPEKWYRLKIVMQTVDSFTLYAIPLNSQIKDKCQTLTLDKTGIKGILADAQGTSSLTADDCWY
ncbi:type IV pilin protein [Legionella cardiaca]|uniref:Type IV pilin protein n=1 Tax=Legionella cardiaca TaxID=1071983 RepID=A0ABY8AUM3_9GAMM|nr:type IV pilin protein [Legionella cardiaca]WED43856.1 type IV pilin protein [Legionella cardiaca]